MQLCNRFRRKKLVVLHNIIAPHSLTISLSLSGGGGGARVRAYREKKERKEKMRF